MCKELLQLFLLVAFIFNLGDTDVTQDKNFWYDEAREALHARLVDATGRRPRARNVIMLVGDGLGVSTLTAARLYKGQHPGQQGEDTVMAWDKFPAVALAKTYNLDAQIGESSACATALLCGVKANFETVGLDGNGLFENCYSSFNSKVDSLLEWARQEGKWTGIVTNTRITHATPAALYAHSPSRYWEDDSKVPPSARKSCKDIARQLVEDDPGRNINVLMGGGRRHWLPKVARDPEQVTSEGRRLDGRNLIEEWLQEKKKRNLKAEYVWNKQQMDRVDPRNTDFLLGLFAYSHMDFEADRDITPKGDPSLVDMARKAVNILRKNPKGFLLFVESGRIDHAHHYNNAYRALDETLSLESTLLALLSQIDQSETLVVLTSDHSHVLTIGGLATPRGNPILGADSKVSDVDGLPYSTLLYGNGPGYNTPRPFPDNMTSSAKERNAVHGAAVPRQWATHGGEDVPVYAQGPMATTLFSGTMDQSFIPHAVAYIACLGEHKKRCSGMQENLTFIKTNESCVSQEETGASIGRAHGGMVLASSMMSDMSTGPRPNIFSCILLFSVLTLYSLEVTR